MLSLLSKTGVFLQQTLPDVADGGTPGHVLEADLPAAGNGISHNIRVYYTGSVAYPVGGGHDPLFAYPTECRPAGTQNVLAI